jgi:hypothetical protein
LKIKNSPNVSANCSIDSSPSLRNNINQATAIAAALITTQVANNPKLVNATQTLSNESTLPSTSSSNYNNSFANAASSNEIII